MFDLLILWIANAAFCLGVYEGAKFENSDEFDDYPEVYRNQPIKGKMFFWWIRYYGSYLPEFWRKPFYLCILCMASVYSIPMYSVFCYVNEVNLIHAVLLYPLYSIALIGFNSYVANKVLN